MTVLSMLLRDDQNTLYWGLPPILLFAIVGIACFVWRRRALSSWDLRVSPAAPSALGPWSLTLSIGLLALLAFAGVNLSVPNMPST